MSEDSRSPEEVVPEEVALDPEAESGGEEAADALSPTREPEEEERGDPSPEDASPEDASPSEDASPAGPAPEETSTGGSFPGETVPQETAPEEAPKEGETGEPRPLTSVPVDEDPVDEGPPFEEETEGPRLRINEEESAAQERLLDEKLVIQVGSVHLQADGHDDSERSPQDRFLPPSLRPDALRRVQQLFVPSADYARRRKQAARDYEGRVFVVHGVEYAGKLTTAVHWGLDLLQTDNADAKIYVLRQHAYYGASFTEVLEGRHFESQAVHVFEDALDRGRLNADLIAAGLDALNGALEELDAFVILTTERRPEDLEGLNVVAVDAQLDDLQGVFLHHLERYGSGYETVMVAPELAESARRSWPQMEPYLRYPVHVERFCHKLSGLATGASADLLMSVAQQAGRIGQESLRQWFAELSANARLYALLLGLFGGTDRRLLDEIYLRAVVQLRRDGIADLCDPRQLGLDDLLERVHATEVRRFVEFEDRAFDDEVRRQIKNHHHLLWSLQPLFLHLLEEAKAPQDWPFRTSLGAVLGHLGLHHRSQFADLLEVLAANPSSSVASVVGSALERYCRHDREVRGEIRDGLVRWVKSGFPDRMWAAGAAVWRIFQGIVMVDGEVSSKERPVGGWFEVLDSLVQHAGTFHRQARQQAYEELRALVATEPRMRRGGASLRERLQQRLERWTLRNIKAVIYALRKMVWVDAEAMVTQLETWLALDREDDRCLVAHLACQRIFEDVLRERLGQPGAGHEAVLRLAAPLLAAPQERDPRSGVQALMLACARWLKLPAWRQPIHGVFLGLAHHLDPKVSSHLRCALVEHWLGHEEETARRMGKALLARSRALRGLPLWPPGGKRGVLAVDDASRAPSQGVSAQLGPGLFHLFNVAIDLDVLHLGERKSRNGSGEPPSAGGMAGRTPLLLPALEDLDADVGWLLVVTRSEVIDLPDLDAKDWRRRLLIVGPRGEPDELPYRRLAYRPRTLPLRRLEREAEETWLRAMVEEPMASWWSLLEEALGCDQKDSDSIRRALEVQAKTSQGGDWQTDTPDPARLVVCTLLAWGSVDLVATVELLVDWLVTGDGSLRRRLAVAGAQSLLRLTVLRMPKAEEREVWLSLACPLIAVNGACARAWLEAALAWLEDPLWVERLLPRSGQGPISTWAKALPLDEVEKVRGWAERRKRRGQKETGEQDLSEDRQAVVTRTAQGLLLDRLLHHLAARCGRTLAVLSKDQSLGLLVMDGTVDGPLRQRGVKLTAQLIERLGRDRRAPALSVHVLGRRAPLAVPGETPTANQLLAQHLGRPPRLLAPVLESYGAEEVTFVLLLLAGPLVDGIDELDGPWRSKLRGFSLVGSRGTPDGLVWLPKSKNLSDVDAIQRHLNLVGGD